MNNIILVCILCSLDYLSGLVTAFITKSVDSSVGLKGLLKKSLVLMLIGACFLTSGFHPELAGICDTITIFYVANEIISIMENLNRAGVPFPESIQKLFVKMRDDKNGKNVSERGK